MLVASLHALLLLGGLRLKAWHDRGPPAPAQAPLIVWLQGASRPGVTPPQALPTQQATRPSVRALPVPAVLPASPQAITLPAPVPLPAAAEVPLVAPSLASSATLNLALPALRGLPQGASGPWRSTGGERNPALDDPRSNRPRPTLESRIAAALGGNDQITEYRLEDGSVRLKRDNSCVVVRPNRAGTLDPFNASAQIRPRLLDRC